MRESHGDEVERQAAGGPADAEAGAARQPLGPTGPAGPAGEPAERTPLPLDGAEPRRRDGEGRPALGFHEVLDRELDAVRRGRELRQGRPQGPFAGDDAVGRAHDARLSGLALSGGGIRSATFNLGVLQALARVGLLSRFDYLSVNSGGGYIGGWLGAWIRRRGVREVERALARDACRDDAPPPPSPPPASAGEAPAAAGPGPFERSGGALPGEEVEAAPIRFLRRFSNYLTPQLGAFSADTWTMVVTYLRNLTLNLGVVVLLLAVILLSPRLLLLLSRPLGDLAPWALIVGALGFLLVAIVSIGLNLAEIFPEKSRRWPWFAQQGWVQALVVLPLFASAWLGAMWLWYAEAGALGEVADAGAGGDLRLSMWAARHASWYEGLGLGAPRFEGLAWALLAGLLYLLLWLLGGLFYLVATRLRGMERPPWEGQVWRAVLATAPLAGAVGGGLVYALTAVSHGLERLFQGEYSEASWHLLHVNVWKAPGLVLVFILTAFVHTGLMGRTFPESMRQWWSRLGAWMLIYAVSWLGLFALAIYGPVALALAGQWAFAALSAGWAGTTAAGVLVGRQSATRETGDEVPSLWRRLVIAAAPQVFIVGILALVALGIHLVLSPPAGAANAAYAEAGDGIAEATAAERLSEGCTFFWASDAESAEPARRRVDAGRVVRCHSERLWNGTTPGRTLGLLALVLVGAVVLSWRVDINEFSMHQFYRNRLIRAFLGASNDRRRAQPFTGFDPKDDLPLSVLDPEVGYDGSPRGYDGPYPIHNATLNLVAGQELAWQERKGASFVLTPRASGYDANGGGRGRSLESHGFRPTAGYRQGEGGLTLGTAMAISGAAASPNMGAGTTPAMSFLLTVFNVRLGWWLGNPRHKRTWSSMGPSVGAAALLAELFGGTDDTSRHVYLSDGGHFENLAIYELVRRRCRFILASDAGADPGSTFADLGNAIRKCCTDFGIDIDIDTARILRDADSRSSLWHCAVGSIRYDKTDPGAAPGVLLYLKSSLTGDESRDVLTYGVGRPAFPHESTADQWFGESQFESYRKLGEHVAMRVLERADDRPGELGQELLMVRLQDAWYPPSRSSAGAFTRHAEALDALFERLRTDRDLHFLVEQIYPEWQAVAEGAIERRERKPGRWLPESERELLAGFLFCHALLQQMENVYLDLGLETEYLHPDNRGWMNLFKHWTWAGTMRATWAVTAGMFGARFQTFCSRRLGFEPGRVEIEEHRLDDGAGRLLRRLADEEGKLNFLEESLVEGILARNGGAAAPDRLLLLRVAVGEPETALAEPGTAADNGAGSFRFTFGFALARGGDLVFLRVQDHLRRMGLGRRALRRLVREHGVAALATPPDDRLPPYCHREGETLRDVLRKLFGSVRNEQPAA